MYLPSFFDEPPSWQTCAIPAAGLLAALLSLFVGRFLLARSRTRQKQAAHGPAHDPFDHGSVTERRGTPRRKGNAVEVLITDAEAAGEPVRAWVVDRSMGGLCLHLNDELAPGTVLSLKPRNGPPATPWVQVEVRSCKKDRSGYETGCQFVRTPPWAVLLLFG
jgi:PilZ domain